MRLDLALIERHPGLSRRKAREVIEKGQVSVGGRVSLRPGDEVQGAADVVWDPHRKALPRARSTVPVLHRDEHLLVVDKPAGLLSVPTTPGDDSEDTALARVQDFVRRLTPRHPFVGGVHRLDRDTSGALAFALSPACRAALRSLFREHRIERAYSALVRGEPVGDRGIVDLPIRDAYEGGRRRVARPGEEAAAALTRWSVVERFPGAALLEVELGTGRQHQVRIHLAHIGLPIVGDPVYARESSGGTRAAPAPPEAARQMLHARRLGLAHPISGEEVRVESPLPEDFRRVLGALRAAAKRRPRASHEAT